MHPELIKATLRMKGLTAASVAASLGVSHVAVGYVIRDRNRSIRIARRICELTGIDPSIAWPGRYPEFRFNPIRFQTDQFKEVA
ncbi:MAG: putative transcriptional regulator [Candidatus Accumulibacter sp. BA-94]|uniref:helix-turn-helix domain-containing protein n=1 Tax=Accumulibacter sp. TaxID=2053492 RepID=UPI0004519C10|nr:helix-turn-helix domain-containing protein [Accumulibacter sp.]EXI92095.1 MAG: putative transcriptional regulator [Candidatus Accumulibacter sp. BA-94]HRD86784.1 helix-turn-helix domain-containing protein [Accumulibacter sp.]